MNEKKYSYDRKAINNVIFYLKNSSGRISDPKTKNIA